MLAGVRDVTPHGQHADTPMTNGTATAIAMIMHDSKATVTSLAIPSSPTAKNILTCCCIQQLLLLVIDCRAAALVLMLATLKGAMSRDGCFRLVAGVLRLGSSERLITCPQPME